MSSSDLYMTDQEKWNLITRNLSGEASCEEREDLELWLTKSQDNREFYQEICVIWLDAKPKETHGGEGLDVYEKLWNRIETAAPKETPVTPDRDPTPVRRIMPYSLVLKMAASFLLLVSFAGLGYYFIQNGFGSAEEVWLSVANPAGERSKIVLPDSSVVWLNASSSFSYPEKFGRNKREVKLSGEAFFEVKENKAAPFSVTSGSIRTTVLGTSFNISSFEQEDEVSVAVVTGKVQVSETLQQGQNSRVLGLLRANEKILFNKQGHIAKVVNVNNVYNEVSWKDGVLRLREMNFGQIARRLESWYGVTIRFENEAIRNCELEGSFTNLPLDKVLKMLSMTANFNYQINEKEIVISGKECIE